MRESTIKIITGLILAVILVVIYILNPNFYSDFWRIATSGNMQETMEYIASFGIWAMVFSFLLDVLINALGFLPSIFVFNSKWIAFWYNSRNYFIMAC